MNQTEFNQWWTDFTRRFPDTGRWMAELRGIALADWREAFEKISLADALEVNRRLMSGDLEPVKYRENTPATICKYVRALNDERYADQSAERTREQYAPTERRAPTSSAKADCICIDQLLAQGQTLQQASAEVFPDHPIDPEREPRYRCFNCRDTQWVEVWSNLAIAAAIKCKKIPVGAKARMSVRCQCSKKKGIQERYTPEKYCIYDGDEERLREWIAFTQAEDLRRRRHSEFDAFNQRQPV